MPGTLNLRKSLVGLPRILLYCYRPVSVASMYAHAASPDPLGYISSPFNRAKRDQKLTLSFIRTAATFSTSRPPRSAYRCRSRVFHALFPHIERHRLIQVIRGVGFFHRSGGDGLRSDPEFSSVSKANTRAFCDTHSESTIVYHLPALRLNFG